MFKAIEAKDLFSWESLNYQIEQGISQITGFNHDDGTSEGSGKSAILNIMCWTLYGKIPKDAKVDEVIRHGKKHGLGRVILDNGHEIVRSRKPNDLFIRGTNEEFRGKDAKETQAMVIDILGMDFDTFCQTIYFAQNYPKKFISANEAEKAKILSDIQDLSIFDRARESARTKIKETQNKLHSEELTLIKVQGRLQGLYSQKDLLEDFIQQFQERKDADIAKLQEELTGLEAESVEFGKVMDSGEHERSLKESIQQNVELKEALIKTQLETSQALNTFNRDLRKQSIIQQKVATVVNKSIALEKKLTKFKIKDKCPTCSGPINEDQSEEIFGEKRQMEQELDQLIEERNFLIADSKTLEEGDGDILCDRLTELEVEQMVLNQRAEELRQEDVQLTTLRGNYSKILDLITQYRGQLKDLEASEPTKEAERLGTTQELITNLEEDEQVTIGLIDYYRNHITKFNVLKDGFKELKSHIFSEFLHTLSVESTYFAHNLFEVGVSIEFNNNSDSGTISKIQTEITLDGIPRSLGLYSGGQYRRIQLAVDLALAKILGQRSQNPINFRILDEYMKDLSLQSMEKVVKLLEGLAGSSILIEHNPIVKSIVDSTFHVEYKNGVSRHAP